MNVEKVFTVLIINAVEHLHIFNFLIDRFLIWSRVSHLKPKWMHLRMNITKE